MKNSAEPSTTINAGPGKVVLGRFDVESEGYNQKEGCHVFIGLLTPVGRITWVKLYDELLPAQDLAQVRAYNTAAASEDLPVRIPLFLDYALAAASLMRLKDPRCTFRKYIEHCHENVWIPDAERRSYYDYSANKSLDRMVGSSTVLINHPGRPGGVIHGVGLPRSHDLYYSRLIRDGTDLANGYIEGLLLEDDPHRFDSVNSWRMNADFDGWRPEVSISQENGSTSVARLEVSERSHYENTGRGGFGLIDVTTRSGSLNAAISSDLQLPARGVRVGKKVVI